KRYGRLFAAICRRRALPAIRRDGSSLLRGVPRGERDHLDYEVPRWVPERGASIEPDRSRPSGVYWPAASQFEGATRDRSGWYRFGDGELRGEHRRREHLWCTRECADLLNFGHRERGARSYHGAVAHRGPDHRAEDCRYRLDRGRH